MRFTKNLLALSAMLAFTAAAPVQADEPSLAETWISPEAPAPPRVKVLVVAITDDQDRRHDFESKFVSHLRTAGIEGVPSDDLVPRLERVEDRESLLTALEAQGIDGAITVRLVPVDTKEDEAWVERWKDRNGSDTRIRKLVEETIPVPQKKAKRYGIEVGLWEAKRWSMIWSGRSGLYTAGELEGQAGSFVQKIIRSLKDARMIP